MFFILIIVFGIVGFFTAIAICSIKQDVYFKLIVSLTIAGAIIGGFVGNWATLGGPFSDFTSGSPRYCSYTYSDGTTCNRKAVKGSSLCSYHKKELNKAVEDTKKYATGE